MGRYLALVVVLAAVLAPSLAMTEPVWPGRPTDTVRRHLDEVVAIALDSTLSDQARQEATRRAVAGSFDFGELARRTLGEHSARMTAGEREKVTAGLRAMLTTLYTSRIARGFGARLERARHRIWFLGESASGSVANVTMRFQHAGEDLPLQVALIRRGREWRIADIALDGVRLSDNLRAQVAHLSHGTDYGEVLDRLRTREQSAMASPGARKGRPSP